jgi:hypothetical protein
MNNKTVVKSYFPPLRPSRHSTESTCPAPQLNGSSVRTHAYAPKDDENVTKHLPDGQHRGFSHLKSQPGIFRCLLHRVRHKGNPSHADFVGTLTLGDYKVSLRLWIHTTGDLGLRVERLRERQTTLRRAAGQ